ncbi:MAG: hypothetical protein JWM16_1204 [Verrucomicrobiales bacterium]|nr:hypothetical protein [Verrucomicrobiales bacterium]
MRTLNEEGLGHRLFRLITAAITFVATTFNLMTAELEVSRIPEPQVSPQRGFFTNTFPLTITSASQAAEIWFTLDGTLPKPGQAGSSLYRPPLLISNTTILRACVCLKGQVRSLVATHTFIFPSQTGSQPALPSGFPRSWNGVLPAYGMDNRALVSSPAGYGLTDALLSLPALSLALPRDDLFDEAKGIYVHSTQKGPTWERPASMELIFPGGPALQVDAGLAVHGYTSRHHSNTLKHSLRLKFRSRYGSSRLRFPLLPDTQRQEFDSLVLRACSSDSYTAGDAPPRWEARRASYIRDQWMRDTMRDFGQLTSHGRYVHLWLDGLYWGLYDVCEALDSTFAADYLGGKKKEYDIIKDYFVLDGGDRHAWDAAAALAKEGFATEEQFHRIQGNNPDGTRNPNYPIFLNLSNYVDYLMVQITSGSQDWPLNNWWSCRRHGSASQGFQFCVWDQEEGNNSLTTTANVFCQPFAAASEARCFPTPGEYHAAFFYDRLRLTSPSFRQFFMDRVWFAHTGNGVLTPEANARRWLARQKEIDRAIVAETARWGDSHNLGPFTRQSHWLPEMNWVANYWSSNQVRVVERYRSVGLWPSLTPPALERLNIPGGKRIKISLSHTNSKGTIHYTLDGRDPRAGDAKPAPSSQSYSSPLILNGTTRLRARVTDGLNWSPCSEAILAVP